ncbi:MAG: hypothetical protein LBI01_04950 [Elusimicrobium sp.]|nr:hypothetical protein [Elusimicrobium sp.]
MLHAVDARDIYLALYPSEPPNVTNKQYLIKLFWPLQNYLMEIISKVSQVFYEEANKKLLKLLDRLSPEA